MAHEHAIQVRHITATYGETAALWNITVDVPHGILGAVIGPNGAGKTTLLKVILGLMQPVSGSVHTYEDGSARSAPIAYVPQRRSVDWDFPVTVMDVVIMGCYHRVGWLSRVPQYEYNHASYILEQVGLHEYMHRPIHQLSGGQQQRVFLARALMQDARIYMLDEPFVGIDTQSEKVIIDLLQRLRDAGKTVLVVHHNLYTVQRYFDWAMLLNISLVAAGSLDTVLTQEHLSQAFETTQDMSLAHKE